MIALIVTLLVSSFPQHPIFTHIRAENGLSQNTVFSIAQDAEHNMWFATMDAIDRYDGYHIKSYSFENQKGEKRGKLASKKLYSDEDGNIYYSSSSLCRYDRTTDKFVLASEEESKRLEDGVCRVMNYCDSLLSSRGLEEIGKINDVDFSENMVWFATESRGLIGIEDNGQGDIVFWTMNSGDRSIYSNQIRSICYDGKGHLWAGTGNGLSVIDVNDYSVVNVRQSKEHPEGIGNNMIKDIFLDDAGGVWVGSFYGGVDYYCAGSPSFSSAHTGLDEEVLGDIAQAEDGSLWIGTSRHGICRYDMFSGDVSWIRLFENNPESDDVKSIVFSRDGKRVYIGTGLGGLSIMDYHTREIIFRSDSRFPKAIYSILEEDDRFLWLGTLGGLYLFDMESGHASLVHVLPEAILCIFTLTLNQKTGEVWIGSTSSLISCRLSVNGSQACVSDVKKYPDISLVQDILSKGDDTWVATRKGLYYLSGNAISKVERLSSNIVSGLEMDASGNIWVGTDNGLCSISSENMHVSRYLKSDGLTVDSFSLYAHTQTSDGLMYFGGIGGMIYFRPSDVEVDHISRRPSLSSVIIDGKHVDNWRDGIELYPDQKVLDLYFSVPNYSSGKANIFYYRMKGASDVWNIAGPSSQVSFSSVKPGRYTFELKSENSYGIPSEGSLSIPIRVRPPWYLSVFAMILYLILFISGIAGLIIHKVKKVTKAKNEEIAELKAKSQEEINRFRIKQYSNFLLSAEEESFLLKVLYIVEENISDESFTVNRLASDLCMTRGNLHIKMKKLTGSSAIKFIQKVKFEKACILLKETDLSIAEIGTRVGFNSPAYFTSSFKRYVGMLPGKYRE